MSELQRAKIVDYIRDNELGEKCFNEESSPIVKLAAWTKVWDYAKSIGILDNKNPLKDVAALRKTLREWRHKINAHKRKTGTSGEGWVPQLSDVDQRFDNLLNTVKGIAKGRKVSCMYI